MFNNILNYLIKIICYSTISFGYVIDIPHIFFF